MPEAKGQGCKREPGELYPSGRKSGAVPATVCGRGVRHATGETREGRHVNPMTVSQNTCQARRNPHLGRVSPTGEIYAFECHF